MTCDRGEEALEMHYCEDCGRDVPHEETEVACSDCGSHGAVRCTACGAVTDLVYGARV